MLYDPGKEAEIPVPIGRYNLLHAAQIIEFRGLAKGNGTIFYDEDSKNSMSHIVQLSQLPNEALERLIELYFRNAPIA